VSLDLDVVVASDRVADVEMLADEMFQIERFPHRLNVSDPGSDVRIQIQLDSRYGEFVERASSRMVLDLELPVAAIDDILRGKIWAVQDATRRASKRQKDHVPHLSDDSHHCGNVARDRPVERESLDAFREPLISCSLNPLAPIRSTAR
jgi:hypothetical protein